ncbi:MAG: hypothetical protein H0T79_04475, partial [Deltaproteobacteria bacterium]|nr:hypothetical protein [Deltaproteobacteria bacterium]
MRVSWLGFAAVLASCAPPTQYGRGANTYYAQPRELGTSAAPVVAAP